MNKYAEQSKQAQDARRRRICQRKRGYASKEDAYQKGQYAYRCKHCGCWHRASSVRGKIPPVD